VLRKYTVQPGDTLISIAEKFYGNPKGFTDIFAANQDVIEDPYQLRPGTELYIPPSAEQIDREIHHHDAEFQEAAGEQSQPPGQTAPKGQQRTRGPSSGR